MAKEVQTVLQGPNWQAFITQMYGNLPAAWSDELQGIERLRVIVNALTRLRFCTALGEMEFKHHLDATQGPPGFMPWFDIPERRTQDTCIAFGHWSTLTPMQRQDVIELDAANVTRCLRTILGFIAQMSHGMVHAKQALGNHGEVHFVLLPQITKVACCGGNDI